MKKIMKKILLVALAVVICMGALPVVRAEETSVSIGDKIKLGTYNGEPITWVCVDIDENGPLMMSKSVLCTKEYDAPGSSDKYHIDDVVGNIRIKEGSNCWQDSNIRQWLNSNEHSVSWTHCPPSYSEEAGFMTNFTEYELSCINTVTRLVNVNILESRRSGYCDGGSSDTFYLSMKNSNFTAKKYYYKYIEDTMFLLSAEQFNRIHNKNSAFLYADKEYWLAASGGNNYGCYQHVLTLYSGYNIGTPMAYVKSGVRPAFYLNVDKWLQRNNGIKIYSTHSSNYLSVGNKVDLIVGNYIDDILDSNNKEFITVVSDNSVIDLTAGDWNEVKGRRYTVKAKKKGVASVTFTVPETNESTAFTFYVENPETAYTFYNIPELTYEEGKTTNFYNYGGLTVDDFSYEPHEENDVIDYYTVRMNVYNKCNLYGAVTSYDANGFIYEYDLIERMKDFDDSFTSSVESFFYQTGDLYYLLGNEYYYSGKSITKETQIEIRVPVGGHLTISNNVTTSTVVFVANTVYAVASMMSVMKEYLSILTPEKFSEKSMETIIKYTTGEIIDEKIEGVLKKSVIDTTKGYKLNYNNINEFISEISKKTSEFGFNLVEEIEKNILTVTGVGELAESFITAVIPTGMIIELLYASNNALDYSLFNNEYSLSPNKPKGITINAPNNKKSYVSGGVSITPENEEIQQNVTTHSYIVEDIDLSQVSNTSWVDTKEYMHYKQKMYSITMYKDGDETQPESTVEVKIPLPDGFRTQALKVYHYEDGKLTDMNAYIENDYIVFKTNHFSNYLIIDESEKHSKDIFLSETQADCVSDGKFEFVCLDCDEVCTETVKSTGHSYIDDICEYCGGNEANCNHLCHKSGFVEFIWNILCGIFKVFGYQEQCSCGSAHY